MIRLENVSKYYSSGENNVALGLHNVSIEFKKGEIVAIVGESGSGKSTLLNVISCLDTYEDGEIYYNDMPASGFTKQELGRFRRDHIGFIFQNYNLVDSYTVLQNVMLPLVIKGYSTKEAKEKAKELIKKVGLEKRMHHKGTKLSGGEKQRCVIARALASDSEILACDEPTGNLDSKTGREIIELIKEVASDKLVLIVTHNYEELSDIITRRITLADGELIEDVEIVKPLEIEDTLVENKTININFKTKVKLCFDDILSTPKKSIFTFALFIFIALFTAILLAEIMTYESGYTSETSYAVADTSRLVVYNNKGEINLDDFKDYTYYKNPFVTQSSLWGRDLMEFDCFLRCNIDGEELVKGRMPENDLEVVAGIKKDAYDENILNCSYLSAINDLVTYQDFLKCTFTSYDYHDYQTSWENFQKLRKTVTIVGIYYLEDEAMDEIVITGTDAFNKKAMNLMASDLIQFRSNRGIKDYFSFLIDNSLPDNTISVNSPSDLSYLDSQFKNSISITYSTNAVIDLSSYTLTTTYNDSKNQAVYMNEKTFDRLITENVFEVSVYEPNEYERKSIIKELEKKGYSVNKSIETKEYTELDLYDLLDSIFFGFFIVFAVFSLMVVFFLSYVILHKLFSAKNKDYAILRTLGMEEKDMAKLVVYQTIILGLVATVLLLITALVSYFAKTEFLSDFRRIGPVGIIGYVVIMMLFSWLFALRFNKKIYKFSVKKTLRGGALGND